MQKQKIIKVMKKGGPTPGPEFDEMEKLLGEGWIIAYCWDYPNYTVAVLEKK